LATSTVAQLLGSTDSLANAATVLYVVNLLVNIANSSNKHHHNVPYIDRESRSSYGEKGNSQHTWSYLPINAKCVITTAIMCQKLFNFYLNPCHRLALQQECGKLGTWSRELSE